jgi:hypothetical protein
MYCISRAGGPLGLVLLYCLTCTDAGAVVPPEDGGASKTHRQVTPYRSWIILIISLVYSTSQTRIVRSRAPVATILSLSATRQVIALSW